MITPAALIVTTDVVTLLQVPSVAVSESEELEPPHSDSEPVMAVGVWLTVTVSTDGVPQTVV